MCGIFGTINYRINKENFLLQLNKLQHRGPDGFGMWESEDNAVQLGHRRLAIIDTDSRSNQPMVFNQRYVIVFNGEIYNYIEIKEELKKKGVSFVTTSDTEVLLQLMITEGPSALSKLNGMWAFALYDIVEQTLLLSRDRIGKKPLYYIQQGNQFAFASEMKSLYRILPQLNYNLDFIHYSVAHPLDNERLPDTLIHGIHKFPAGSYSLYKQDSHDLAIHRFYFPEQLLEQPSTNQRFEEAVEHFKELFESSCRLRMRSDVPVGSALSGGIDSGYLVSTLGKLGYGKDGSYTALISSFPSSALDETPEAQLVAANAGVPSKKVIVQPAITPDHILEAIYSFEEIYLTSPISFFQTYQQFRKNGIVVTLDGHGGDELFGGYPFDMSAKLRDDFPNPWRMKETLSTINSMYGAKDDAKWELVWRHYKTEIVQRKKEKITFLPLQERYYRDRLFHSTFYGILPTLLRNYDHYSMYAGVEVRMPYLDHRIIAFAFTLPNEYRVRKSFSKAIIREAARPVVPASILSNKVKSGWNSPMGEWLTGVWKTWLMDEINSQAFSLCDLINPPELREKMRAFYKNGEGNQTLAQNLWVALQPYFIEKANKLFA